MTQGIFQHSTLHLSLNQLPQWRSSEKVGWRAVGERLACDMAENRNHPPSPENTVLNMLNVVKRVNPTNPPSPRRAGQREEPAARTGPMTPCTCTKIKNKKLYDTKGGYEAQRTYSTRTPVRALFKTGILFFRFFFFEDTRRREPSARVRRRVKEEIESVKRDLLQCQRGTCSTGTPQSDKQRGGRDA